MLLSFRLDKRPGESHLALDGKKSFIKQNRKGKIAMTKTSRQGACLGSFLVPEIDMIFGDGVGASIVAP